MLALILNYLSFFFILNTKTNIYLPGGTNQFLYWYIIMNNLSPKAQMIQLIEQCLSAKDYNTTHECLKIYKSTFGRDDFYMTCMNSLIMSTGPSVTLIYIKQSSEDTQTCLENVKTFQNYKILILSASPPIIC